MVMNENTNKDRRGGCTITSLSLWLLMVLGILNFGGQIFIDIGL